MVSWKMGGPRKETTKVKPVIFQAPIFHETMIMGERVNVIETQFCLDKIIHKPKP